MKIKLLLSFIAFLALTSCRKPLDLSPDEHDTSDAFFYIKGKLNENTFTFKETPHASKYAAGYSLRTSRYEGVSWGYFGGSITKTGDTFPQFYPSINIELGTTKVNYDDDFYAYLNSFINIGKWNYAINDEFTEGVKSVIVHYTDQNGKVYHSMGPQTESFTIKEIKALPENIVSEEGLALKISFSCTLFPVNKQGPSLVLSNGEALIKVSSQLY